MDTSAALYRASNITLLDYPLEASVDAALEIVDEVVIVEGSSIDDTWSRCIDIYNRHPCRVRLRRESFLFDTQWQQLWWEAAVGMTDAEWLLWIDADEIIPPHCAPYVKSIMELDSISVITFPFFHFYATSRYVADYLVVKRNARLGRRSAGYRMVNTNIPGKTRTAACHVVVTLNGKEHGAHRLSDNCVANIDVPILHYGWCRDAMSLAWSQEKQDAWYENDPRYFNGEIPENNVPHDFKLRERLAAGQVRRFDIEHPEIIRPWLRVHRDQWRDIERTTRDLPIDN